MSRTALAVYGTNISILKLDADTELMVKVACEA